MAIPLNAIVSRFSTALQPAVARPPRASDFFALPLSAALQQLPVGSVKVSFSDLKRGSTPGVFATANQLDSTVIEIPLPEILSRLNPAYLSRRPEQRQMHVPDNVGNVFASSQGPEVVSRIPEQVALPHLAQTRDDLQASKILAGPQFGTALTLGTTSAAAATAAASSPMPASSGQRPPLGAQSTPLAAPAPTATSADPQAPVKIALAALARHWPEPSRREILSSYVAASVHIPFAELQAAMARGKAVFRWQQIRAWLVPPAPANPSHLDAVELDLPLSVLIPPFLARRPVENNTQKRLVTDEIPDVFLTQRQVITSKSPPAAAPITAAAAKPLTLEPRLETLAAAPHVEVCSPKAAAAAPSLAPVVPTAAPRGGALPSEVVARACRLNGVAGALVATPDGLVVAGQVPPHQSLDSLAAVLPPVFNRLGQYMRDLKLGEVTQVEVLLGKMPLQIFKLTHAYFAVLGKEAEGLPKGQLSVLASQLSAPSN